MFHMSYMNNALMDTVMKNEWDWIVLLYIICVLVTVQNVSTTFIEKFINFNNNFKTNLFIFTSSIYM